MQETLEICGELVFRRTGSIMDTLETEYTVIEQDVEDETFAHEIFFQWDFSKPFFATRFSTSLLPVVCRQLEKRGWKVCNDDEEPRPPRGLKWQLYLSSKRNLEKKLG